MPNLMSHPFYSQKNQLVPHTIQPVFCRQRLKIVVIYWVLIKWQSYVVILSPHKRINASQRLMNTLFHKIRATSAPHSTQVIPKLFLWTHFYIYEYDWTVDQRAIQRTPKNIHIHQLKEPQTEKKIQFDATRGKRKRPAHETFTKR